MTKRSKIPPPLLLDPLLTPLPTVQRQRVSSPFALKAGFPREDYTTLQSPTPQQRLAKSFVREKCSICEEPLTTKLSNERVIELECDHKCHDNCYLVMLDKDDISILPECSLCGVRAKPTDDSVLESLYSQTLVNDDNGSDAADDDDDDDSINTPMVMEKNLLPEVPFSGFKPTFFGKSAINTPVDQMTDSLNSAGFDPPSGLVSTKLPFAEGSISSSRRRSTRARVTSPRCTKEDLIKPHVSIVSEFAKHVVNDNSSRYTMSHVINIFTNELNQDELGDDDSEIKRNIHDKVISILKERVHDSKGVDFDKLPHLTMFDHFEISLDGFLWEYVHGFIFSSVFIIVNEELGTIIGSVLLKEHFTNSVMQEDGTLGLYFSTTTLSELQIKSENKVVLSKWDDFFAYKLRQEKKVSLLQMTTNSWSLIEGEGLRIPEEAIKLNTLTEKGLDLPLNLMKLILPAPKRLPVNVVVSVPLYHADQSMSNSEYLKNFKQTLHMILDELEPQDKFGLILLGRSGMRVLGLEESSFFGMATSEWEGWDTVIDELECYTTEEAGALDVLVKSLKKLTMLNSELTDPGAVKKLVMIRSADGTNSLNTGLQWILDQQFSIHDNLVAKNYGTLTEMLMTDLSDSQLYHFNRYASFTDLHHSISHTVDVFKRTYINELTVTMEIQMKDCISFSQIESAGVMVPAKNEHKWTLKLKDLEDGFYHNARFDIGVDLDKICDDYHQFEKNQLHEIPVMKYTYDFGGKTISKDFEVKLRLNKVQPQILSPMEGFHGARDSSFIDIPLLPPLSSFKDSLFVKKQVELMVIDTLAQGVMTIHELISLVFGLIRGCSTNYVEFFKHSRFNKYKNFSFYIDELVKRLNEAKDETAKKDLMYSLRCREEL